MMANVKLQYKLRDASLTFKPCAKAGDSGCWLEKISWSETGLNHNGFAV
jgi:hypothetical protein